MTALTVEPEDGESTLFGRKVKTMQTGITVADGAITGTLKYISTGAIAQDWGPGNFLCLKIPDADIADVTVKVGLSPSQGSGLVELDTDKNGVFKITDKDSQQFVVLQQSGIAQKLQKFSLSGLTLETG